MDVIIATAAEYIVNQANGMTGVVGAFRTRKYPSFPVALPPFHIVLSGELEGPEIGEPIRVTIAHRDADGNLINTIVDEEARFDFPIGEPHVWTFHVFVNSMVVPEPCEHQFEVKFNDRVVKAIRISILQEA